LGAVVHDAPILRFLIKERFEGELKVLPGYLERQLYGIALPQGSALREPLNAALLEIISGADWELTMARYLSTTK
jgi:ABC-type amino acid transport substrate-binding protein